VAHFALLWLHLTHVRIYEFVDRSQNILMTRDIVQRFWTVFFNPEDRQQCQRTPDSISNTMEGYLRPRQGGLQHSSSPSRSLS
jgi:hypothetical protein